MVKTPFGPNRRQRQMIVCCFHSAMRSLLIPIPINAATVCWSLVQPAPTSVREGADRFSGASIAEDWAVGFDRATGTEELIAVHNPFRGLAVTRTQPPSAPPTSAEAAKLLGWWGSGFRRVSWRFAILGGSWPCRYRRSSCGRGVPSLTLAKLATST
jgi:hypothetical protein